MLIVSPTHAEGDAITATLREMLKTKGQLVTENGQAKEVGKLHGEEHEFQALVPLHLTEAERSDASLYQPGMVACSIGPAEDFVLERKWTYKPGTYLRYRHRLQNTVFMQWLPSGSPSAIPFGSPATARM